MTTITAAPDVRSEHDLLGDRDVPAAAYWGVHTLRAVENFPITGQPLSTNMHLVRGLAAVKLAAARTNLELGLLDPERAAAIETACTEVMNGHLHEQFVVDVIQGGAGTSSNMNANEVIANRALEILGHPKGDYTRLHPNDHVNLSQSTNDVYPTAVKLGTIFAARELLSALAELEEAFAEKALEFRTVVKMGRTQLQDAVPMTLGQEFGTYAITIGEDRLRLAEAGQLQLNAFEPIIVHSLHKSISHLEAACRTLTARCIQGITANTDHLRQTVEQSIGLVTALNPHLGYTTATAIAQEALATGKGVAELVLEHGLLTHTQLQELLSPERLANLTK